MTDFEHTLREMMRERAGDIQVLPDSLRGLEGIGPADARGPNRRAGRVLLVAAVIVLVAAISVGVAHVVGRHSAPPAHPSPLPSGLHNSCPTTLPVSWPRAGVTAVPGTQTMFVLAVAANGDAVVGRVVDGNYDVALARGDSAHAILTFAHPRIEEAIAAETDGDWALIVVARYPWNDKFQVLELDLLNLHTGDHRVVTRTPAAEIGRVDIGGWAIGNGRVYWAVGTWRGRVHMFPPTTYHNLKVYDIATGATTTDPRSTGPGNSLSAPPRANAYGVTYQTTRGSVTLPNPLPTAVAAAVRSAGSIAQSTLATDGSAYAWVNSPAHIGWWRPGQPAVTVYREPDGVTSHTSVIVAGTYVLLRDTATDAGGRVLDVRTGAVAKLPSHIQYAGSGGGVLWSLVHAVAFGRRGDVVANQVSTLPQLRCR